MNTGLSNITPRSWRGSDAAPALKPLTPADLGQQDMRAPSNLKPLTFADFVVGSKSTEKSEHDQLVEQTQKFVSQTFYGTILKQMHESPFKSELFSGGRGGEAFGGLMDQHLADRMAKTANNKLVKNMVHRIEARTAYAKQKQGGAPDMNHAKIQRSADNATPALRA